MKASSMLILLDNHPLKRERRKLTKEIEAEKQEVK